MPLRILIADDSPTIQKVIKIALARHVVDIVSVKAFADAMSEVAKTPPGAILIDASLPGAKGPEDFLSLRRQAGDCPTIVLVGSYEMFDDSGFIQAGLKEIIRKPFESNTITKTLSRVIGKAFDGAALATTIPGLTSELPGAPLHRPPPPPPLPPPPPPPGGESGGLPPPPPPQIDERRRGQRAFGQTHADVAKPPELSRAQMAHADPPNVTYDIDRIKIEELVRSAVLEFCQKNFPQIAREVLTAEIRRIAEERSRHLSET